MEARCDEAEAVLDVQSVENLETSPNHEQQPGAPLNIGWHDVQHVVQNTFICSMDEVPHVRRSSATADPLARQ